MQAACILTIVSVILLALWNCLYFTALYSSEEVSTGNDGIGFVTVTIKQQVVFSLWIAAVISAFFSYYICVFSEYKNLYREAKVKKWIEENIDYYDDKELLKDGGEQDEQPFFLYGGWAADQNGPEKRRKRSNN